MSLLLQGFGQLVGALTSPPQRRFGIAPSQGVNEIIQIRESAVVRPFAPEPGDRLVLATDGLTNHVYEQDLREGARCCPDAQIWANYLVDLALQRGSRDNVTCIVVIFQKG